jgi:hypothetical protein
VGQGFTIEKFSRFYRIPVVDYAADPTWPYGREDDWLLVASGCGIMMSIMDAEPRFRWCVDIDSIRHPCAKLDQWLIGMEMLVSRVCVAGWFSITNPEQLRAALAGLETPPLVYAGTGGARLFPGCETATTLADFLRRLDREPAGQLNAA